MKILVTGATGLLGARFYHDLSAGYDVLGTYFSNPETGFHYLSLFDRGSVDSLILASRPDLVIHSAGIADPDSCERDKNKAEQANRTGTEYIVDACKKSDASLIFISSSAVFSEGTPAEEDAPKPANFYGETKLAAEQYIRANLARHIILRPAKLYGYHPKNKDFTRKVVEGLRSHNSLGLDDFVKHYPVIAEDVVRLAMLAFARQLWGRTYHISTCEPYTNFEWGKLIARACNINEKRLEPVREKYLAHRPADLSLSIEKAFALGFRPVPLKAGVDKTTAELLKI